jgi:hypothetical protein
MFLRNYIDRLLAKKSKIPKRRNRIFDNDNYHAKEHSAPFSAPKWTRAGYNGKLKDIITEACKEESENNSDQDNLDQQEGEDSSYQETQEGDDSSDQNNPDQEKQDGPAELWVDQENESDALSSLRLAYDSDGNTTDIESESEEEIVMLTSEGGKEVEGEISDEELEMDD